MLDRSPTSTLPQWLYAEDTLRRYVTSEAIYDVTSAHRCEHFIFAARDQKSKTEDSFCECLRTFV